MPFRSFIGRASVSGVLLVGMCLASTVQAADADAVQKEVAAVIHATADRWNSQNFASVLELWDADEPLPMYLAEEQKDWFIGQAQLRAYLGANSGFVEAIREEMSNIRVQPLAADLAAAVWDQHFEAKYRGSPPIGEDIRVTAIFRKKPEGWRYVHYAEAPMTGTMYLRKLMQKDVKPEFEDVYREAQQKKASNSTAQKSTVKE